jgi:hypothetical protein
VDIAYVGNVHSFRRTTGEMCLLANKHVLLEKPFACSVKDAEYLIGLAKERNLFLMEVRSIDQTENGDEKDEKESKVESFLLVLNLFLYRIVGK